MSGSKEKPTGNEAREEEEEVIMTEEEKYYSDLYTRSQYRRKFGAKCCSRVEMILNLKIDRVKSSPITMEKSSGTVSKKNLEAISNKLETFIAMREGLNMDDFYEHSGPEIKENMQNIDLKVQRLARQVEEIKQVNGQLKRQKGNPIYQMLTGTNSGKMGRLDSGV